MIDLSKARLLPFDHQRVGVEALVKLNDPSTGRIYPGCFFLADEMGAGKTKQVIDAAVVLYRAGEIERLFIIAPAAVRAVWYDEVFGELQKHLWADITATVNEFHAKIRTWHYNGSTRQAPGLRVTITNYEFVRAVDRLRQILPYCNAKTWLVLDESSAVKGHNTAQTKAATLIRRACGRVVELNGTPIANNPGDLYSQMNILDPRILGVKSYFHFRARYARMGGYQGRQILGWHDIEDLQKRIAPYVLRRLKEQCLDLPAKLDSIVMPVALTETSWRPYKEMRDDMVANLHSGMLSSAAQAIVKAIRLSQITSGFIGGVEQNDPDDSERPDFLDPQPQTQIVQAPTSQTLEIGREKLDFFLRWWKTLLEEQPNLKLLVWCRFRYELNRLMDEVAASCVKDLSVGRIWGGQKRPDRNEALQLLDPRSTPRGPVVVCGTPKTGSMGLNLTAAHTVVYLSNDYSLMTRLQSEDRVHRPGQVHAVSYFDVIATGPAGQKTIDHHVVKALKSKEDLANMTTSAWLDILEEE